MKELGISKSETIIDVRLSLKEFGTLLTALGSIPLPRLKDYNVYNRIIITEIHDFTVLYNELSEIYNKATQ